MIALPHQELLDPLPAQLRRRQPARLKPAAQPSRPAATRRPSSAAYSPRRATPTEYDSTNEANGPVINTLLTLLDGLATISSFSDNEKDDDRQNRWRYADVYAAISPTCEAFLRRDRHNDDIGIFVKANGADISTVAAPP